MKWSISLGAATLALAALPVSAFAQAAPMSDVAGGKNVTCQTFLRLSPAAARDVLYFANGYAAGVEDQIAAGTPTTPSAGTNGRTASAQPAPTAEKTSNLASLSTIGMDQLRSVCTASPTATVLSVVPGGRPVSGSGTITGNTNASTDSGGSISGGVRDTTGATSAASPGNSVEGAASQVLSAPTAVTTPGSVSTNPATGIATPNAGSTTMPSGTAAGSGQVEAPTAGAPMGGEAASPGAGSTGTTGTGTTGTAGGTTGSSSGSVGAGSTGGASASGTSAP